MLLMQATGTVPKRRAKPRKRGKTRSTEHWFRTMQLEFVQLNDLKIYLNSTFTLLLNLCVNSFAIFCTIITERWCTVAVGWWWQAGQHRWLRYAWLRWDKDTHRLLSTFHRESFNWKSSRQCVIILPVSSIAADDECYKLLFTHKIWCDDNEIYTHNGARDSHQLCYKVPLNSTQSKLHRF